MIKKLRCQYGISIIILMMVLTVSVILNGCTQLVATKAPSPVPTEPSRIALLLPLSGNLATSSQAIRNGFFAAYNQDKQQNIKAPTILVIDTTHGDIINFYQQAVHAGAKVVVGPLTKEDVTRLAQWGRLSVPTVALNSIGVGPVRNLYQFGLSPIDEAQQAALHAWTDGYRQALVVAPNNAWGHDNANVFIEQFRRYGGNVIDSAYYNDQASLDPMIRQLLQVNAAVVNNKNVPSIRKRRQDADMIFLIAQPQVARQIKPLLNYYYASDLPIYATSHVYQGIPNPTADTDLNGIQFCDMPWTVTPQHMVPVSLRRLRNNIIQLWPDTFAAEPRLFALGIDSYDIISLLNNMQTSSRYLVDGATGMLHLNAEQRIVRQLYWARFQQGVASPL